MGAGHFGIVITKAEVVSWFRIQEMFRFIATAILVAGVSVALIERARRAPALSSSGDRSCEALR